MKRLLTRTVLLLAFAVQTSADQITLKNGDRSTAEAQLGQTLSHRFSSRVSLKEQLFFFPNLTDGGTYRINFDASLVTDISRRIGWQLTLSDRYLSDPPPGLQQNDLLLTTGLKIKLGKLK